MLVGAAAVLALLAGGLGWLAAHRLSPQAPVTPAQTFHVSTAVPRKPPFTTLVGIAPDATFVVYSAWPELEPESTKPEGLLVVRRLDRDETTVIEGTEGARNAALSPDGRWVAFACAKDRAATKFCLKKLAMDKGRPTGKPETVCELTLGVWFYLGWASDREIVFARNMDSPVYSVSASGGEPRVIVEKGAATGIEGWGGFRPLVPGQSVLGTRFSFTGDKLRVDTEAIDLASGKRTTVLPDVGAAQLVRMSAGGGDDGTPLLVAMRVDQNGLIAVRFDPATQRTIGDPVTVWSGGLINDFDVSPGGTLAVAARPTDFSDRRLAWIDEKGQPQPIPGPSRGFGEILVSPDGGRVLANLDAPTGVELLSDIWLQDLERRTSTRIPIQGIVNGMAWSGDGQRIAYGSVTKDEMLIWERPVGGSGEAVKLFSMPIAQQKFALPSAWTPDGKILAIIQQDPKTNSSDVLMLEPGPPSTPDAMWKATPYLNSPADEHAVNFSPDGKWVLFCSVESGRHELYMQHFTGAGSGAKDAAAGRVQVSTNGHDGMGWWSPDGKEVRFIDADQQVVSVEVKTEPALAVSLPKVLYSLKDLKRRNQSWAPGGRLMVILQGENERASRIDLVVNFLEEIKGKISTAR